MKDQQVGDDDVGDNLEEATLNLKLTQQHAVKEDKEGAAEDKDKDPAADSADEKSDTQKSSRSSEVDHRDINFKQKHTTYRSHRSHKSNASNVTNNLRMPQAKPKSELAGLAMMLGIKDPNAKPQTFGAIGESEESDSRDSFQDTDRSATAKKGLLLHTE